MEEMKRLPEILKTGGRRCRTLVLEGFYVWCVSTMSSRTAMLWARCSGRGSVVKSQWRSVDIVEKRLHGSSQHLEVRC